MDRKHVSNYIKIFSNVLRDMFSWSCWRCIVLIILLGIESVNGYLMVRFINFITVFSASGEGIESVSQTLIIYIALLLLTLCISKLYSPLKIEFDYLISLRFQTKIKTKLGKIQYESFESSNIYEKISRVNEKCLEGFNTAIETVFRILEIITHLIVYIYFLSEINIVFAILVTSSICLGGIVATRMSESKHAAFIDVTEHNLRRDYLSQLPLNTISHQEFRSNRLQDAILKRYKDSFNHARDGYMKIHKLTIFAEMRALLLMIVVMFLALLYLSIQSYENAEILSTIISIGLIFESLYSKAEKLSYYISNRIESLLVVNEYYEIMEMEETPDIKNQELIDCSRYDLTIDNISYKYPKSNDFTLKNISFQVKQGEKIMIVGDNGAGKTTFCNILTGLLNNFAGEIRIGNWMFSKESPVPLQMIRSINQQFNLYSGLTLRENICLDDSENSSEGSDSWNILGIEDFFQELPKGENTVIGQLDDEGIEVSKGQAQKIAIARLASHKTPIMILDEPTAYMDPLTEIDTYKLIYKMFQEETVLFVSHRLGFAPMADRIIVFKGGTIIEMGTHKELMEHGGEYANMFQAQKSIFE